LARSPPNCDVSIPEQNELPAPVSTKQPASSWSENASASSSRSSIESALRFSGRFSVTTTTSSSRRSRSRMLT
jgi:hypothetical protein